MYAISFEKLTNFFNILSGCTGLTYTIEKVSGTLYEVFINGSLEFYGSLRDCHIYYCAVRDYFLLNKNRK